MSLLSDALITRLRETKKKNLPNQTPSPHESDFRDDDGDQLLTRRRVETIRRNDHEHRDALSLQGQTERYKRNQSNWHANTQIGPSLAQNRNMLTSRLDTLNSHVLIRSIIRLRKVSVIRSSKA